MWNHSHEDWLKEVKRSLKTDNEPEFFKKISGDGKVSAISVGCQPGGLQKNVASHDSFLVVQNYHDLKKGKMDDWLAQPDIGLRIRQFNDLAELSQDPLIKNKSIFLSQPFPFLLSESSKKEVLPIYKELGSLNLGWSPLSFGLTRGEILKRPFAEWEKIFQQEEIHHDFIRWFYLSSAPYQWAGAEPHVELSVMLSLALSIFKELDALGIPVKTVAPKITFGLSLSPDILLESAKITAMKVLWDRLVELIAEGETSHPPLEVYALPSLRYFSGRDPWNNIMRLTLMSFAALTGGAQGFKCIPYDVLNQYKTKDAIRITTNIPLILKKEGFLNHVSNPYDGSSLFQQTVDTLCEGAWAHFQEIERKGGVYESVRSGWLQAEIKRSCEVSQNGMSYRETELVGVNKFVVKDPQYSPKAAQIVKLNDIIDPLFLQKNDDDYLSVEPLLISALSYEWEKMQCASDQYLEQKKERPSVVVIKGGGPVVEKKAAWLQGLLHLGGLEVDWISAEKVAEVENHQALVIILASNDDMEDQILSTLKSKGTEKIWSYGNDRQGVSVDRYISTQTNALEFVQDVHRLKVEII